MVSSPGEFFGRKQSVAFDNSRSSRLCRDPFGGYFFGFFAGVFSFFLT